MRQRLELSLQPKLILTPEMKLSFEVLTAPVLELRRMVEEELLENPFLEELPPAKDLYYPEDEDQPPWWERLPARERSLQELLLEQVGVLPVEEGMRNLMGRLVLLVDNRGFLSVSPQEAASRLNVELETLERARGLVMEMLEPEGCGCVDAEEFLRFQLKRLGFPCRDTEAEAKEALERGLSLKPFPAWGVGDAEGFFVEPDAFVVKVGEHYQVYLNERYTPRLVLNESYRSILYRRDLDPEVLEFLKGKMRKAVVMMKAIEQRNRTLRRTVEAIVEFEREFLDRGPAYLRPLTLREVSEKIDLHISTVSRVVNSKYVHTPQGTYPLRFFFEDKGFVVKRRIREIIEGEDKSRPLSDNAIAQLLRKEGFDIARRTVAKYREELGIPSSSKRRVRNAGDNNRKKR